jgi:hypothetical protein
METTRNSYQEYYTACEVVERVAGMCEQMEQDIQFRGQRVTEGTGENKVGRAVRSVKARTWSVKYPFRTLASIRRTSGISGELFLRFGAESSGDAMPGFSKMRGRMMNLDRRFRHFSQGVNTGVLKGAQEVRKGQGRLAKRAVMIEHPAGQHRFGRFFQPLIDQNSYFTLQIRSVIQASELEAVQGRT